MERIFTIDFEYSLEEVRKTVQLTASVEQSDKTRSYRVYNIGTSVHAQVLPDQRIRKLKNQWVHMDSNRESKLSLAIGQVIDRVLSSNIQNAE
jgi:hypothetical protein